MMPTTTIIMEEYILLTPGQADQVRGVYKHGHVLSPEPYGEEFILPAGVLNADSYAAVHGFLKTLPVIMIETPIPIEDDVNNQDFYIEDSI
jgi:hypothetical protein